MPIIRNGMVLASLKRGTSQIAFVFKGTVQVWAHEVVFVLGASSAGTYLVDIVNSQPGLWASSTPTRIVVPAGVERGSGTSWVFAPMPAGSSVASSWGGKLTLEVRGTLSGIGGTANSGVGGDLIVGTVTGKDGQQLIVNVFAGAILRPGGGGGGRAGNGGQGRFYTGRTVTEGPAYVSGTYTWVSGTAYANQVVWAGTVVYSGAAPNGFYNGGWYYYIGYLADEGTISNEQYWYRHNAVYRQTTVNDVPNYTAGGVAPNAGRGQGYDGAASVGGNAVAGGTNAGASGKSGDGGAYGNAGTTGANGSNGNYSNGLAGAAPGLAGCYLRGAANVNFTNNGGTLLGRLVA